MTDMIAVAIVDLKAGPALDYAVAKAVGEEVDEQCCTRTQAFCPCYSDGRYRPSTDWEHGRNIIEPLEVASWHILNGKHTFEFSIGDEGAIGVGSSMLEAACIAIVKSKFGDAVSVPRALWGGK